MNVDMHSDVYESIWFEVGTQICICILVLIDLTLIKGQRSARKQNLPPHLSHKVYNQFG